MLQQRGIAEMIPDGWCLTPAFISEQASSKPRRIRHQEVHAQSHCQQEGEVHYTLHSSLRYNTAAACFGQDAGHCRHRGAANSAASVADRTLQNMREIVVAKEQLCCTLYDRHLYMAPPVSVCNYSKASCKCSVVHINSHGIACR